MSQFTNQYTLSQFNRSCIIKVSYYVSAYAWEIFNPFTPTDHFRWIQNNEWKSPLKLLSVERVIMHEPQMTLTLKQSPEIWFHHLLFSANYYYLNFIHTCIYLLASNQYHRFCSALRDIGGLGPVQKVIGHMLFSAKIIIELELFFNLSNDRIVIFVCFLLYMIGYRLFHTENKKRTGPKSPINIGRSLSMGGHDHIMC